jgi:tRNA (cmo5U34)-methyltransferase
MPSTNEAELERTSGSAEPEPSSVLHIPDGRWAFDEAVTHVFADMLKRSIPQYEVMRRTVFDVGTRFVMPDTRIVDLGCARGDALMPFISKYGTANRYVGIDTSKPMLEAAANRFKDEVDAGMVEFLDVDLRRTYPHGMASLTLCVLTLQFTPLEYRHRILRDVFNNTAHGGALILVEKVLGPTADLCELMVDLYHGYKASHGYGTEEIERKRLSLEGVLVPMTAHWNEELLRVSGFQQIDCFWRWMNFGAWIAIKP